MQMHKWTWTNLCGIVRKNVYVLLEFPVTTRWNTANTPKEFTFFYYSSAQFIMLCIWHSQLKLLMLWIAVELHALKPNSWMKSGKLKCFASSLFNWRKIEINQLFTQHKHNFKTYILCTKICKCTRELEVSYVPNRICNFCCGCPCLVTMCWNIATKKEKEKRIQRTKTLETKIPHYSTIHVLIIILCSIYDRFALHMLHVTVFSFLK